MKIMHNYPQNDIFLYHNQKLHIMIEMYSKYDNMHTNRIFNALNCINNHVTSCINCMLSMGFNSYLYTHPQIGKYVFNYVSHIDPRLGPFNLVIFKTISLTFHFINVKGYLHA